MSDGVPRVEQFLGANGADVTRAASDKNIHAIGLGGEGQKFKQKLKLAIQCPVWGNSVCAFASIRAIRVNLCALADWRVRVESNPCPPAVLALVAAGRVHPWLRIA